MQYPETDYNLDFQTAAQLYVHVCYKLDKVPAHWVVSQAVSYAPNPELGDAKVALSNLLKSLKPDQLDKVLNDVSSPQSCKLKEWYNEHCRNSKD